ncbi:hypothetical protein M9Y10_040237 [Tritrichomonas musculus]|uniref:Uncharacterized protein n=1 Tax=Tritrichomonas musculus TaxID=1915356 RepID=A0ABR2GQ72_9EUKA
MKWYTSKPYLRSRDDKRNPNFYRELDVAEAEAKRNECSADEEQQVVLEVEEEEDHECDHDQREDVVNDVEELDVVEGPQVEAREDDVEYVCRPRKHTQAVAREVHREGARGAQPLENPQKVDRLRNERAGRVSNAEELLEELHKDEHLVAPSHIAEANRQPVAARAVAAAACIIAALVAVELDAVLALALGAVLAPAISLIAASLLVALAVRLVIPFSFAVLAMAALRLALVADALLRVVELVERDEVERHKDSDHQQDGEHNQQHHRRVRNHDYLPGRLCDVVEEGAVVQADLFPPRRVRYDFQVLPDSVKCRRTGRVVPLAEADVVCYVAFPVD